MKIKETYVSFTGLVDTGKLAYFINTSSTGIGKNVSELITLVENFNCIVFEGDFIFQQIEEIHSLIKKVTIKNPFVEFIIYTNGYKKPTKITNFNNIKYIINLQYKNDNIPFEQRLNETVINWFIEAEAKFICVVKDKEEITEALNIADVFGIPKRLIYITTDNEDIDKMINFASKTKLNFAPNYKKLLWADKGKFI